MSVGRENFAEGSSTSAAMSRFNDREVCCVGNEAMSPERRVNCAAYNTHSYFAIEQKPEPRWQNFGGAGQLFEGSWLATKLTGLCGDRRT